MMIPFGHETVTLVRRIETQTNGKTAVRYETGTLTGCSWRRSRLWRRVGETLLPVESVVCRIPAGQTRPAAGDLMILGEAAVSVAGYGDYQALIERYADGDGAFVVASVADNARPGAPLPHYAASS